MATLRILFSPALLRYLPDSVAWTAVESLHATVIQVSNAIRKRRLTMPDVSADFAVINRAYLFFFAVNSLYCLCHVTHVIYHLGYSIIYRDKRCSIKRSRRRPLKSISCFASPSRLCFQLCKRRVHPVHLQQSCRSIQDLRLCRMAPTPTAPLRLDWI